MAKTRFKRTEGVALRFDESVVLKQCILSLFAVGSFDKSAENLKAL